MAEPESTPSSQSSQTPTQTPAQSPAQPAASVKSFAGCVSKVRGGLAMLIMLVLLAWPAWSLIQMRQYLNAAQPEPAAAIEGWQMLARRFAPVRQVLPPGTVLAYQRSERTYVAPSRIHDVHFVCIPLIVTETWYDKTDLVLADMVDDNELRDLMKRDQLTLEYHLGAGLAVLRRPAKTDAPSGTPDTKASETVSGAMSDADTPVNQEVSP